MRWFKSWPFLILFVAGYAIFLLPEIPYYQNWMPYGYELGGVSLVMIYLSCGFGSLGLYGLVSWMTASQKKPFILKVGMVSFGLTAALMWCYGKLMNLTLSL